ncbi:MAG: hypothetical protein FWD67_09155 [Betaproteobacteria bacterium]|nr:hypothetical protein [Betaproteobacteria bacterium]
MTRISRHFLSDMPSFRHRILRALTGVILALPLAAPANGTVTTRYDAPGNLTAISNENGEPVRFEHDAADRPVAQIGLDGKRTETRLDRDLLGRLLKKTTPEGITIYARDALGRVTRLDRTDLAGKPIDSLEFGFDASNNLVAETQRRHGKNGRHTLKHAYDALGNRTSTTLPDGKTSTNALGEVHDHVRREIMLHDTRQR